jgi:branched-chain amino acid aminotransferase
MAFLFHFWRMEWVCYNGLFYDVGEPLFSINNRGLKFGDGLFETMKFYNNTILLSNLHFERLYSGLRLLQIDHSTLRQEELEELAYELCKKNNCTALGRVRLSVYRKDGGAEFLIEAFPLPAENNQLNEKGWVLGTHPHVRKSIDVFSNSKSISYLPYVLADLYAKQQGLDEALVLNALNKIADGSKTNLFLSKSGELFTPALHQGCVDGVMSKGFIVHQTEINEDDLLEADEVFMTNAIRGIRWVQQYQHKLFESGLSTVIYKEVVAPLYEGTKQTNE